jgi:hypothetical protein
LTEANIRWLPSSFLAQDLRRLDSLRYIPALRECFRKSIYRSLTIHGSRSAQTSSEARLLNGLLVFPPNPPALGFKVLFQVLCGVFTYA